MWRSVVQCRDEQYRHRRGPGQQTDAGGRVVSTHGDAIVDRLAEVAAERGQRARDPALAAAVRDIKAFQHARFERTYEDLSRQSRYTAAVAFFLEDLYGPGDFSDRDDQFKRIVPALVRLFPADIVATVALLAELHALSEQLDTQMARAGQGSRLDEEQYGRIWRLVGHAAQRERQIELLLNIGSSLDRFTRNPLLRHSLRLMRVPAQAAGLAALQRFLERGFDTFRAMRGAKEFLATIGQREHELAQHLFNAPGC